MGAYSGANAAGLLQSTSLGNGIVFGLNPSPSLLARAESLGM